MKLHNFSSIFNESVVKMVLESFREEQHEYKQSLKILEISFVPWDLKQWLFLPRDLQLSKLHIWNFQISWFEKPNVSFVLHFVWEPQTIEGTLVLIASTL